MYVSGQNIPTPPPPGLDRECDTPALLWYSKMCEVRFPENQKGATTQQCRSQSELRKADGNASTTCSAALQTGTCCTVERCCSWDVTQKSDWQKSPLTTTPHRTLSPLILEQILFYFSNIAISASVFLPGCL